MTCPRSHSWPRWSWTLSSVLVMTKPRLYGIIIAVQLVLPKVFLSGGGILLFLQSYFSQINYHNIYHVVGAQWLLFEWMSKWIGSEYKRQAITVALFFLYSDYHLQKIQWSSYVQKLPLSLLGYRVYVCLHTLVQIHWLAWPMLRFPGWSSVDIMILTATR